MQEQAALPFSSLRVSLGTALVAACLLGCGGGAGEDRHGISGTITFDGEPIVDGMIIFEHDETKFPTSCTIDDGYYENQSGKGHHGGKYKVTITGYESDPGGGAMGTPLWEGGYVQEIELPDETTEWNHDISKADVTVKESTGNPFDET